LCHIPSSAETLLASHGGLHRHYNIKLCTPAYKFVSKVHHFRDARPGAHQLFLLVTRPLMDGSSSSPTQPKRQKALSLEDILRRLGPITDVSYEPFKCEPEQPAQVLLPPSFPRNAHPFDYFSLFFTPDLFQTITTNTNRYASLQQFRVAQERAREWTNLLVEEFYIFIGSIIYMGVHDAPQTKIYWNMDFNKGPLHTISAHISLSRFE
jgi:transposase IS4-like protein